MQRRGAAGIGELPCAARSPVRRQAGEIRGGGGGGTGADGGGWRGLRCGGGRFIKTLRWAETELSCGGDRPKKGKWVGRPILL